MEPVTIEKLSMMDYFLNALLFAGEFCMSFFILLALALFSLFRKAPEPSLSSGEDVRLS